MLEHAIFTTNNFYLSGNCSVTVPMSNRAFRLISMGKLNFANMAPHLGKSWLSWQSAKLKKELYISKTNEITAIKCLFPEIISNAKI